MTDMEKKNKLKKFIPLFIAIGGLAVMAGIVVAYRLLDYTKKTGEGVEYFSVADTLLYALIGFFLTIAVLMLLWGFIALMKFVLGKCENIKKPAKKIAVEEKIELAPGSSGQIKTNGVPDKEVAMIMAIVADELQTPLNELKFISVKEIKEDEKL